MISLSFITNATNFDCRKANLTLEKTICDNLQINELDGEMGKAYLNLRNQNDW